MKSNSLVLVAVLLITMLCWRSAWNMQKTLRKKITRGISVYVREQQPTEQEVGHGNIVEF